MTNYDEAIFIRKKHTLFPPEHKQKSGWTRLKTTENRTKERISAKLESSHFCPQHHRHRIDFGLWTLPSPDDSSPMSRLAGPWVVAGGCTGSHSGGAARAAAEPLPPRPLPLRSLEPACRPLWSFVSRCPDRAVPPPPCVVISVILDFIL